VDPNLWTKIAGSKAMIFPLGNLLIASPNKLFRLVFLMAETSFVREGIA
jgi:hypothetical protein